MIAKGDPKIIVENRRADEILSEIRQDRQWYMNKYNLSPDDLWILLDWDVHMYIMKNCRVTSEGPDRITRSAILGMHTMDEKVKNAYVIPKHRPPRDEK